MHPFERRLGDLASALQSCAQTYLKPEPFRRNVNHFLTVSRTVTFLIQKQKAEIRDFESWYSARMAEWKDDELMTWAKEARNQIEKEGDLETLSQLRSALVFSYLAEEDSVVETDRNDLLRGNVDRLMRRAIRHLPPGTADAAVVSVERRWVVNSLPAWELLEALTYIYARIHGLCVSLSKHLGETLDRKILPPSHYVSLRTTAINARYIKVRDFTTNSLSFKRIDRAPDFQPSPEIKAAAERARASGITSLATAMAFYAEMAELTFKQFGNHIPIAFLFDKNWTCVNAIPTAFADQADKFIFWRHVGDTVRHLHAHGLIWVSEVWRRSLVGLGSVPIREMDIKGEALHVVGVESSGARAVVEWTIHRREDGSQPTLERDEASSPESTGEMFFFAPVTRAMGIPDEQWFGGRPGGALPATAARS